MPKRKITQAEVVLEYLQFRVSRDPSTATEYVVSRYCPENPREQLEAACAYAEMAMALIAENDQRTKTIQSRRSSVKFVAHKVAARFLKISPEELTELRTSGEAFGYRDGADYKYALGHLGDLKIELARKTATPPADATH